MVQGTKATLKAEALETEMKSQVLSYLSSLSISDLNNINLTKWNSKEFVSLNLVENVKKKTLVMLEKNESYIQPYFATNWSFHVS